MCSRYGDQASWPLYLWIGRGNPYLRGYPFGFLRSRLKPKELKVIPEDLFDDDGVEMLERTMVRRWMALWPKSCSYY